MVTTTEDHPFWNATNQEWQPAEAIVAGETVLSADSDRVAVAGIDWATQTGGVAYNLTVADLHTYFVTVGDEQALVHNMCGYKPPPEDLEAFPEAQRTKSKNQRKRWVDSEGNIYEWDYQHGAVEKYNKRGKHLGEYDPVTGDQLKPPDKTQTTNR